MGRTFKPQYSPLVDTVSADVNGMYLGLLFDTMPWWIAAPLLQLCLLVVGMALDESYVNRATVITGALALAVHAAIAGNVGFMVGLYLDIGFVIGAYGLYAYIVDAYVDTWFRVAAFFFYSPLSVFLVIIIPDILFPAALIGAAFGNLQLQAALYPREPYYFGPESRDSFENAVEETTETNSPSSDTGRTDPAESLQEDPDVEIQDDPATASRPGAEPVVTGGDSTERGILPEFMRRL